LSKTSQGVSRSGGRVRCRIIEPFCGNLVVIGRVSGPPGNDSSITRWAKAGGESSASPPRPALPTRERRVIEVPALVIGAPARPDTVTYCQVQTLHAGKISPVDQSALALVISESRDTKSRSDDLRR